MKPKDERILNAVIGYLERVGVRVVEALDSRTLSALEDVVRVLVLVAETDAGAGEQILAPEDAARAIEGGYERIDRVSVIVIAEDRALLRHHRSAHKVPE